MRLSEDALAVRAGRLTGTTGAAAVGVSPHDTRLWAYQLVTGLAEVEMNEAMEWGLLLQPPVASKFASKHHVRVEACETRPHPDLAFLAASGDYTILDTGELLEIKTASARQRGEWGEPGTDEVPYHYLVQVAIQLAVYRAPAAHVAVLFGGQEYQEYYVRRDEDLEGSLVERLERFYLDHIVPRIPPDPVDPEDFLVYLENRYPRDDCSTVTATPAIERVVSELVEARKVRAQAAEIEKEARGQIEAFMGAARRLDTSRGHILWSTTKDRSEVDWQAVAWAAGASRELISEHTTIRPGARQFRPYLKESLHVAE
jgi:putative phage-type endonuclease